MNDDLHPDAVDEELRRRFGAGAPSGADPDAVLDAMRPRLQRARTRRRASFASAIAGVAVLVVVLAFALGGNGGDGSVRVPPATKGPVSTVPTAPTTAPAGGAPTPDSLPDDHGDDSTAATTPTAPVDTVPGTVAGHGGSDRARGPEASVLVRRRLDHRALRGRRGVARRRARRPPGYTAEVHDNGPTRVEVRFSNGQTEWRIRVDVDERRSSSPRSRSTDQTSTGTVACPS